LQQVIEDQKIYFNFSRNLTVDHEIRARGTSIRLSIRRKAPLIKATSAT